MNFLPLVATEAAPLARHHFIDKAIENGLTRAIVSPPSAAAGHIAEVHAALAARQR